jgi:hypothetical protein
LSKSLGKVHLSETNTFGTRIRKKTTSFAVVYSAPPPPPRHTQRRKN